MNVQNRALTFGRVRVKHDVADVPLAGEHVVITVRPRAASPVFGCAFEREHGCAVGAQVAEGHGQCQCSVTAPVAPQTSFGYHFVRRGGRRWGNVMTRQEARKTVESAVRSLALQRCMTAAELVAFCHRMQSQLKFATKGDRFRDIKVWAEMAQSACLRAN